MVSLFRSVKLDELQQHLQSVQRVVGLLLEGVRLHAVTVSPHLREKFQETIRQHEQQVESNLHGDTQALLLATGATLQSMQLYAKDSEAAIAAAQREYQHLLVLLSRELARMLGGNEVAVTSLQSVGNRIHDIAQADDIRVVKVELESVLKAVQTECRRQEEASARLRELSSAASEHPLVAGSFAEQGEDPVTGLPSDSMARRSLQELYESRQDAFLALFRMDNLKVVNNRYGRDAGNRLLMEGSQVLAQAMHSKDRLFRWGGPSFVAILNDRPSLDAVKAEMDRLVNRARDHNVLFEGRSVFFKVAISVLCLRTLQFPDLNALSTKIEGFIQPEMADRRTPGH